MYMDKQSLNILTVLYDKYKLMKILEDKIRGQWTFNMEKTKTELANVKKEIAELELPLFETVEQMRIKVMAEFVKTLPKDSYRDKIHNYYNHLGYRFDCHINLYIFNICTSYNKFISRVDNIFNPDLFMKCLEENKAGGYVKKPIRYLYGYTEHNTFRLSKYQKLYKQMLLVFPEEKKEIRTYYHSHQEENIPIWERDEYDDSYGAWLEKGGQYKEDSDDPYESAYDPFDGGGDF